MNHNTITAIVTCIAYRDPEIAQLGFGTDPGRVRGGDRSITWSRLSCLDGQFWYRLRHVVPSPILGLLLLCLLLGLVVSGLPYASLIIYAAEGDTQQLP